SITATADVKPSVGSSTIRAPRGCCRKPSKSNSRAEPFFPSQLAQAFRDCEHITFKRRGRGGRREEKPKDFSACSAFKRRILVKYGAKPAQPRYPLSPLW